MKLKKTFSFSDKNQIWRLLISDSDKLIIETRNTDLKEAYFHGMDLQNGKKLFKNFQLDEKYWIGIEGVYSDVIFFHLFAKPDMPDHKGVIAFSILEKKIIWRNENYSFLTVKQNKVFVINRKIVGQDYFVLDIKSGEIIEELEKDSNELNSVLDNADQDYSDYIYPESRTGAKDYTLISIIDGEIKSQSIIENVEFIHYQNLLMFNYFSKITNNLLDNVFVVYDIEKKKKILSEVINRNLNSFSPDTFFLYKNLLILLKNKNEIVTYKIV